MLDQLRVEQRCPQPSFLRFAGFVRRLPAAFEFGHVFGDVGRGDGAAVWGCDGLLGAGLGYYRRRGSVCVFPVFGPDVGRLSELCDTCPPETLRSTTVPPLSRDWTIPLLRIFMGAAWICANNAHTDYRVLRTHLPAWAATGGLVHEHVDERPDDFAAWERLFRLQLEYAEVLPSMIGNTEAENMLATARRGLPAMTGRRAVLLTLRRPAASTMSGALAATMAAPVQDPGAVAPSERTEQ